MSTASEPEVQQFEAKHRFARISARKVQPLASLVRGKFATEALELLRYQPQRGARILEKAIKSAMGNAEDPENGANRKRGRAADADRLVVTHVVVDGGPMFKRVVPKSRGQAYLIKRRFAHVRVVLTELE